MKKLLLLIGVIGLGVGSWFIYKYLYPSPPPAQKSDLLIGGGFFVVALICFFVFFYQKFKDEGDQDYSITKL